MSLLDFDEFDEEYWMDADAEEDQLRLKTHQMGVLDEKVDELFRRHLDAFEVSERDLEELSDKGE